MAEDSCKIIEKCIKDMIFNSSDTCSTSDVEKHLEGPLNLSGKVINVTKNCRVPGDEKFVSDIEATLLAKSDHVNNETAVFCNFSPAQHASQVNFDHECFIRNKSINNQTDKNNVISKSFESASIRQNLMIENSEVHVFSPHQTYNQQMLLSRDACSSSKVFDNECDLKGSTVHPLLSQNKAILLETELNTDTGEISNNHPLLKFSKYKDPKRTPQKEGKTKRKKKKEKKKNKAPNEINYCTDISISQKSDSRSESSISSLGKLSDHLASKENNSNKMVLAKASLIPQEKKFIKVNTHTLPLARRESFISRMEGKTQAFCFVCDHSTSDVSEIAKHYSLGNHDFHLKAKETECLLQNLPEPLSAQTASISKMLKNVTENYGLSHEDVICRRNMVEHLNSIMKSHIPECALELVGSSATGFGLKESEVDIVLKVPKDKNSADMLFTIFEVLELDSSFKNVHSEFRKKIPQINFLYICYNLTCNICIDNGTISELTKLLRNYFELDPRVPALGVCFRLWAKMCEVDQQDKGTLPAFCYPLMLIHFLQQVQPAVLPVLQEMENWSIKNTASIGELWIKLLRYYSVEYQCGKDVVCIRSSKKVSCEDKNWGTKILAIEDPIVHRNLAHVIPNRRVFQYIHNCFVKSYSYFGYPRGSSGQFQLATNHDFKRLVENNETKSERKNYPCSPILDDDIDAFESPNLSSFLEDTDPDLQFEEVLCTINNLALEEINTDEEDDENEDTDSITKINNPTFDESTLMGISSAFNLSLPSPILVKGDASSKPEIKDNNRVTKTSFFELSNDSSLNCIIQQRYCWDLHGNEGITDENLFYTFSAQHFKKEKSAPLVCSLCQKLDHLKTDCPDEILPEITPLPPMTPEFKNILNSVCEQIMKENQPSAEEQCQRDYDMTELQSYICELYPNAVLEMFGSFCNGFGFTSSDMDLCLKFKDNLTGEGVNCVPIIEEIALRLRKNQKLMNVIPITTAKVPIVKFVFRDSGLEGDISLYNTLAQHNTKMLDAYCKIDPRVQVLGYTLKYFAKVLRIGDASRGSLSSYAYILMVLFFLQQRQPPVIPVLQELHDGKKPVVMVDGWNAWFYDRLEDLTHVWPDFGKNSESVGELWLGLLQFYTEQFDSNEYVVCIRQKQLLTRFKKLWNSTSIAIEDPFDLQHNLGSGLSRRMNNFITKAFIRGRTLFGTPISRFPGLIREKEYLFDRHILCDGQDPPNDRGCRFCGKIGHIVRECPRKNQQKQSQRRTRPKNQNCSLLDASVPQGSKPISVSKKGYDKKENFSGNSAKYKNQRNLPKNINEKQSETPPHRIQHLLSLQRFPPPGFSAKPQHVLIRHPAPFTIQSHSTAVHRPATSVPFPVGSNIQHLMINNPMKNSQNYAVASIQHGRLPRPPDHLLNNHPQNNRSHFEYSPTPNNLTYDTEKRLRGCANQGSSHHVSHQPSPGMIYPSVHPLNASHDFPRRSDQW